MAKQTEVYATNKAATDRFFELAATSIRQLLAGEQLTPVSLSIEAEEQEVKRVEAVQKPVSVGAFQ